MIPIARPLASDMAEKMIAMLIEKKIEEKKAVTGIKSCQKLILSGEKGLLVLTADTTPMDIITHLPGVCENKDVKYVFVKEKSFIPNKRTCVFLKFDDNEDALSKLLEII